MIVTATADWGPKGTQEENGRQKLTYKTNAHLSPVNTKTQADPSDGCMGELSEQTKPPQARHELHGQISHPLPMAWASPQPRASRDGRHTRVVERKDAAVIFSSQGLVDRTPWLKHRTARKKCKQEGKVKNHNILFLPLCMFLKQIDYVHLLSQETEHKKQSTNRSTNFDIDVV